MNHEYYVQVVKDALLNILSTPDSGLGEGTRLEDDLGFDSGMFIELIMELEDRVPGFEIDPARLHREDLMTIGSTATFLAANNGSQEK